MLRVAFRKSFEVWNNFTADFKNSDGILAAMRWKFKFLAGKNLLSGTVSRQQVEYVCLLSAHVQTYHNDLLLWCCKQPWQNPYENIRKKLYLHGCSSKTIPIFSSWPLVQLCDCHITGSAVITSTRCRRKPILILHSRGWYNKTKFLWAPYNNWNLH